MRRAGRAWASRSRAGDRFVKEPAGHRDAFWRSRPDAFLARTEILVCAAAARPTRAGILNLAPRSSSATARRRRRVPDQREAAARRGKIGCAGNILAALEGGHALGRDARCVSGGAAAARQPALEPSQGHGHAAQCRRHLAPNICAERDGPDRALRARAAARQPGRPDARLLGQ